ncbi:MAG: DUF262 domain-containing protein [Leptospiraceae bacterium]|nr:DUF262 domain-containing protein [Leptospiraceae bacterium]
MQKYSVNQHPIQTLLTWINSGEIAIPEIQRPFVWSNAKVRDLIDSLYSGYPVGYLIAWRNPDVKLKDGQQSVGKRILIDGQQRVTALMAALLGYQIVNKEYQTTRIRIAFHPQEQKFEVANPAINNDVAWVPDISTIINGNTSMLNLVREYCQRNPNANEDEIFRNLELMKGIVNNSIGLIELNSDLDIETVTEIFIRINSQGVVLSQADFAMSKIAANESYGGTELRKCIDYFCHLAVAPEFFRHIRDNDSEFSKSEYFQKMSWLQNENDDLYDPSYTDMLRVSFTSEFRRGRLQDLVALLSGRNFVTKTYEEEIARESFEKLKSGIMKFMNETSFKRFLMIIRSAGFITPSMIRSQNNLNFCYIVYLVLQSQKVNSNLIEKIVRRWLVMSTLTGRYTGSPESQYDQDIRRIHETSAEQLLNNIEEASLSDGFWNAGLPQSMDTSVATSPAFNIYLAAQVYANDKGFLSKDITVRDLLTHKGDVHHLFPKNYLKKGGLARGKYNQIANYVLMQSEINIAIRDRAPKEYFSDLMKQISTGKGKFGAIIEAAELEKNLNSHCIPVGMETKEFADYDNFLKERRKLMSTKIKDYYFKL